MGKYMQKSSFQKYSKHENPRKFQTLRSHISIRQIKENLWGYFFIFPQILGFLVFAVLPILTATVLVFVKWNMVSPIEFTGLENIREVFTDKHELLSHALSNTAIFTVGIVPITLIAGLLVAILLKKPNALSKFYKTSLFLPFVTASAAISLVWYWMLAPGVGLINTILSFVGIIGPEWLREPVWARIAIISYV